MRRLIGSPDDTEAAAGVLGRTVRRVEFDIHEEGEGVLFELDNGHALAVETFVAHPGVLRLTPLDPRALNIIRTARENPAPPDGPPIYTVHRTRWWHRLRAWWHRGA